MKYKVVLTIAGSDSGGGAGIQADIKTISACGCYAASVITAVTAQNTVGVSAVHPIPVEVIEAQIDAVMSDIGADAIKIGMLHSTEVIAAIARAIDRYKPSSVVVDPVMVATSGDRLIEESAVEMLRSELIPRATIITPNIPEAEVLLGRSITSEKEMVEAAKELTLGGAISVMLKAGHMNGDMLTDIFVGRDGVVHKLTASRVETQNTHGTGCTLSSAMAAIMTQCHDPFTAAKAAKEFLLSALVSGAEFEIGAGHGPVDHSFRMRQKGMI